MIIHLLLLLVLLVFACGAPVSSCQSIKTSLGDVHGSPTAARTGVCRYLNIPYANDFKRFETSQVRTTPYPPKGVGSGEQWGPACWQWFVGGEFNISTRDQSEDCLQLNIWTPTASPRRVERLPVMVWVHGGGFLIGSAGQHNSTGDMEPYYDGGRLAERGVIVVSLQYRLGLFGFFQHADGTGGANGLGDQISALRWVQAHISHFGGDPNQVTFWGESSGSVSVAAHTHMPASKGLFQRVISQSGVAYPSVDLIRTKGHARTSRKALLRKVSESFLLTATPSAVINATEAAFGGDILAFFATGVGQPSVDGILLPALPVEMQPHQVDLLIGTTSWDNPETTRLPNSTYDYLAKYIGGQSTARILSHYSPDARIRDIVNDGCIRCQVAHFAHRVAGAGGKVYGYVYDFPHDQAFHGSDLGATFDYRGDPQTPRSAVDMVQTAWSEFARTGAPQVSGKVWPAVQGAASMQALVLGDDVHTITYEARACAEWVPALDAAGGTAVSAMCANVPPAQPPAA